MDDFGQTKVRQAPPHVVRWRWTRNNKGERIRQSNAKLVRWSDGTLCLYVGSERFSVTEGDLQVPYVLCTKSDSALQSQANISSRMMFQPTSKTAAQRGAHRATVGVDAPVVITPQVATELMSRAEAQEESIRLTQQSSRKRKSGPTQLNADFLEEGNSSDIARTKAQFKLRMALAKEASSSRRLMDIKSGNKRRKLSEEDSEEGEESDNSFIASEDDEEDMDISDEE